MSIYTPDEATMEKLANEIEAAPPRPHHSAILEIANRLRVGWKFSYAMNRGGWYRSGGLVTADGERVSDNLETWAKAELDACQGDMQELLERHGDQGMVVTRHSGRTHYFVAPYGPAPADFMQLEVEELQEVMDRKLVDADAAPEDIQELIEPLHHEEIDSQPVGAPRYRFRRLLDISKTLARVSASDAKNSGLTRLLADWTHSSAAIRGHFSDHWIVSLREHQDRYRNPVITATLVSRHLRELKTFQWNLEASGVEMSAQLQALDRAAGYASAWYFHLVSGAVTPPKIAYAIARDLEQGFSYLPDTEMALIKDWVAAPYSV